MEGHVPLVTFLKPLWQQSLTYDASLDRRVIAANFGGGVLTGVGLKVAQRAAGTNMSVDVAAGSCCVPGTDTADQGSYLCHSSAVENVVLNAAPGAGTSRIDAIVAQVRDATVIGGTSNDWLVTKVTGTASASPSPPTVPASAIELARVTVASGTASVTNALITDRRSFAAPFTTTSATAFAPVARDGQLQYDTAYRSLNVGTAAGAWVPTLAGATKVQDVSNPLLGTAPDLSATVMKVMAGTASVSFIGAGILTIPAGFTGIASFNVIPKADTTPVFLTRSTHAPLTATNIPLRAWNASTGAGWSGTADIIYTVHGW